VEKAGRLRKNSEFKYVYTRGKVFANNLLVMYVVPNKSEFNKAGFSVSKKVGKSVVRNKVKRRIRECYRLKRDLLKKGYNIVFVSRVKAADATYSEIEKAMLSLFRKSQILIE
jgi:ribonuclease P protein component